MSLTVKCFETLSTPLLAVMSSGEEIVVLPFVSPGAVNFLDI